MTRPTVSVVLPLHDARRFVAEALASVRAQTVGDWELLVVDDHSTDGSADVVAGAAAQDDRIRVIRPETALGRGSRARHLGVQHAQGQFVAFLDHDDRWHPGHLQLALDELRTRPATMLVATNARVIDAGGRTLAPSFWEPPARIEGDELAVLVLAGPVLRSMSTVVVRAALFRQHGVVLDETMRTADDWKLVVDTAVGHRLPAVVLPVTTVDWRFHGANTMSSVDSVVAACEEQQRVLDALLAATGPAALSEGERLAARRYHAALFTHAANALVVAGRPRESAARYDAAWDERGALSSRRRSQLRVVRLVAARLPLVARAALALRDRHGPVPPREYERP